jgi:Rps23 Pro-64 3,4-dihydroxylase Tpa1-like proline 4-hydroxylase
MTKTLPFSEALFSAGNIASIQAAFNNNVPIRHMVIDNFLELSFAKDIYEHFPSLVEMGTRYRGLNENKSEDSNFEKLHPGFSQLQVALSSPDFIAWLEACTGIKDFTTISDRLGYGLHQGGNNSFLDIHIDYNIHPIKKVYRKLNLILFFNPEWKDEWGGHLELWDKDVKNCIQRIAPVLNRCVIFECSDVSYHGYSKISVPDAVTRKSFYHYYFIPLSQEMSFHDTVFKPRPKETMYKKVLTPVKEFAKNSVKRILLKIGMERFLK